MGDEIELSLFVGVDWGNFEHYVCVEHPDGAVLTERRFEGTGSGLARLVDWILGLVGESPERIGVGIEINHGPLVEMLLERGFRVFALNPKQLDRFRDRFTMAGAKDDRRDARVLADSLRTDRRAYRLLSVDAPEVIELREWSRMADDLTAERRRLVNRHREQLRRYFPQALELTDDHGTEWFLRVLELVPTPAAARRRVHVGIGKILKEFNVWKKTPHDVLRTLRQTPLRVSPGTVAAATAHIRLLRDRLRIVNAQLKECHRKLDEICDGMQAGGQRDIEILRSFPGVARIVLATLLAEASGPLGSRDYSALRALTGVAPRTCRSGKRCTVSMRRACNGRLRNALYHWARVAAQRDDVWASRYATMRRRGHSHGRALRAIGDRILAAAMAALKTQSLYDASRLKGGASTAA
jgi:transposase